MATVNLNPAENYTQPALPTSSSGWKINCLDYQILTKSDGWNQSQTKRLNEYQEFKNLLINPTECFVALAVPYEGLTKYTNYVTDARTKGFKIWHRSHWNAWQGDNSVGAVTSLISTGVTATLTTTTDHLLATGNTITIAGANESAYNGEFTVTVTGADTLTYTMATDPDDTATGTLKWRFAKQTYLDKTYDFIVDNPTLFANGDIFTACVECNNADNSNNFTFRTGGVTGGAFNFTLYNRFLRDQVTYANAGFVAIGKSVRTNLLSFSLSLLNLNGQTLDSGDDGASGGLTDANMVSYMDSIVTIDHYNSSTYRSTATYSTAYNSDLDKIQTAFPSCQIMIGEWGYHTTTATQDGEQYGMYDTITSNVLRQKSYILGVNYWNHLGQTQSSLWTDTSGTVNPGGRAAVNAVRKAFNTGNAANGKRARAT